MTSDFFALTSTRKRVDFEISFLRYLYYPSQSHEWLIAIHCDSNSALVRAYSQVYNGKSRHIALRHDLVKRLIKKGIITFDYVDTKQLGG